MGKRHTAQAIAEWADKQTKPAESPSYTRLTDADRHTILYLHDQDVTQTEIAKRLGRSVSTMNDVIQALAPRVDLAKRKLQASAADMAENVIANGSPRDHIQALTGLGVLNQQVAAGFTVVVGIKDSDISLTLSPPTLQVTSEGEQNS